MVTWAPKDKEAVEATELGPASMGASADAEAFLAGDYAGPSWNAFTSVWNWIKEKLSRGRAYS